MIGALAGAAFMGATSMFGQRAANRQSQANSREQMRFQEHMSSTAHQREIQDLKKAGLNPVLSAGSSGAPGASGAAADAENIMEAGVSTALQAQQLKKEMEATDSQISLNKSAEQTQASQQLLNANSAKQMQALTSTVNAELNAIKAESKVRTKRAGYDEKYLPYDAINRRIQDGLGTINSAKDAVNPLDVLKKLKNR